ncbi:MOSC domain-containing protein [Nocardioides sp. HDW12B]|uniref:MOSC domain-containing protein n=1 Tax=Nocardioides sp. HDW12B TaxID=2714939 RepID=UPI00140E773A|nr:MOSC domain-containing protein [Nocardioides sp. HDW12B]QIK65412.1 MOSC domain-containing protein [Nocardioides sp. HDW12B]
MSPHDPVLAPARPRHLGAEELTAALDHLRGSPTDDGTLALVVRRGGVGEREVLTEGVLDLEVGLVGDTWLERGSKRTPDGSAHPDMQLNVMSVRVAELVADGRERMALAGDQLYLDLDLSEENLPAGTRLAIGGAGGAVIEVTALPHTGCPKFVDRFGAEAMRFVNGSTGRPLRLRGLNARVVQAGTVRPGDTVRVSRPVPEVGVPSEA